MTTETHARVFAALADPVRLEMLRQIKSHGTLCGTDLSAALEISLSLVCHHAKVLVDAGVVTKTKTGTTARYTLNAETLEQSLGSLL